LYKKIGEKRVSAVRNHYECHKLESFGYIFVADIMDPASVRLT